LLKEPLSARIDHAFLLKGDVLTPDVVDSHLA
jgi:hypothetical protein